MRPGIVVLTGLLVAVTFSSSVLAQRSANDAARREVVGLVLSGGGARGGAHLGVIKALEELRVPIDLITGTSIGAAIGGLYASGMTTEDLDAFIAGIDWDAAFLNETPRRLESWQRKREDDLFLLQVTTSLDEEGISMPLGIVQGQVIDTIMSRITLPVATVNDFDQLAIPFRAVASTLGTGEAVILDTGNLARAIRASMAVPAALTPIEIGGTLLIDGGVAMNLPVEPAQAMGAERIIAVDISEKLTEQDQIDTLIGVTTQLTSLLTTHGTTEQIALLEDDDFLITPDFDEEYSSVSFGNLAATVDAGYLAVMARADEFASLQLSPEAYADWKASRPDPRAPSLPTIDFFDIGNTAPLLPGIIESRVQEVQTGEALDVDALETALNRVYGLGVFANVRYELVERDGQQGIELETVNPGSDRGAQGYGLGLSYSSASNEDPRFGLAASVQREAINKHGGEWRANFLLGDEPGFNGFWHQPYGDKALNFFSPSLEVGSSLLNLFENEERISEYTLRSAVFEFGAGREFMDWGEIRGGFRVGAGDTRLRVGDAQAIPYDSFHRGELFVRFSVDTLDNISFPREGTYARIEWRGANSSILGADHDYDQLLISAAHAKTWGSSTLLSTVRLDTNVSGTSPAYALPGLGGFRDLSGLNSHELTGQHVTRIGTSYYRTIRDLALFEVYAGVSIELGNAWSTRDDISASRSIWGGSIWAGVDTPIGPIFLAWGSAEGGQDAFYVFLGRVF